MSLRRVGEGFAEEGPLFYAWDEDIVCVKEWSAELEGASPRRQRPPRQVDPGQADWPPPRDASDPGRCIS